MKYFSIIIGLLLSLSATQAQAQYRVTEGDCSRSVWPGCFGVTNGLPRDRFFQDYCDFVVANNISPEKSVRLAAGYYDFFGEKTYVPREVVRQGPTCMVRWFRGAPCPDYAGLCGLTEKTVKEALATGCVDSIPKISFEGDSVVIVEVCGKVYREKIPLLQVPPRFSTQLQSICQGDSLLWNGLWLKKAGTYFDTIQTERGDSVLVLNLDFLPSYNLQQQATLTRGDTIEFGKHTITSEGTYEHTFLSKDGCDSMVILKVTSPKEVCDTCHQQWSGAGPFAFASVGLDARTGYAGQERLRFNRPVASFGGGYEWRLKQLTFPFRKAPCIGQSLKLQLGLAPTPATYVADRCACNNVPSNFPVTTVVTSGYTVSLLRQWPFVASGGVELRGAWNPTHAEDQRVEDKSRDFSINAFVMLGAAYYFKLKGNTFVEPFLNLEVPVLKNALRHFGVTLGGRARFGGKEKRAK